MLSSRKGTTLRMRLTHGGQRGAAKRHQVLNGIHHALHHPTHEAKLLLDIPLIWINKSSLLFKLIWIVFSITYMEPTVIISICKVHSSFGLSEVSDLFANLSHLWRRKDPSLQVSAAGILTSTPPNASSDTSKQSRRTGRGAAPPHQEAPLSHPSCSSWLSPPGNGGVQACRVICRNVHSSPHTTLLWISYNIIIRVASRACNLCLEGPCIWFNTLLLWSWIP